MTRNRNFSFFPLILLVAHSGAFLFAQTAAPPLFQRLDKNGDGKISRVEVTGLEGERIFKRYDKNEDGFLTPDELPHGRAAANEPATLEVPGPLIALMDLRYAAVPGDIDPNHLSLDIYAPTDARQLPVMIYIHGGSWQAGDKRAVGSKPLYFTSRGFVFVSLNYRLVPTVDLLTQLQDSANAIGWVKKNIAQHGGDPARLHLIGHSAGAHHVAILATNERLLQKAGVALGDLKSVVELDTQALDVPTMMGDGQSAIYGPAFGRDKSLWPQVSPLHHVAKDKSIPPFFLVVANNREQKLAQASAFQEALQKAGVRCEFVEAPQHDHGSLNRALGEKDDKVTQAMEQFHDSNLDKMNRRATTPSLQPSTVPSPARSSFPNGAALHEFVKAYAALGEHRAASSVDEKTADWLADELREAGLNVNFQEFTVPQFQLESVSLSVAGKTINAFPQWPARATPGTLSGPLAQSDAASLKDHVVLLDGAPATRREDAARLGKLAEAGAVAVLRVVPSSEGELHVDNIPRPDVEPLPIPVLVVGSRERDTLLKAVADGAKVELCVKGEWQPQARARNVIATLERGPKRIVVSTPYSGWFRCGGERGSGLAVFLGLANWAARHDSQTSFTFVANSAHELGYAGMDAYLDGHAPPPSDVLVWLHLGANVALLPEARSAARTGRTTLFVSQRAWIDPLSEAVRGAPWVRVGTSPAPNGELARVLPKGYAAINLAGGGNRFMHSPGDGPETTGPIVLESLTHALAAALETIERTKP